MICAQGLPPQVAVIQPPPLLVSLDQARAQLKVDVQETEDDPLIQLAIEAACAALDGPAGWLGRSLGVQQLRLTIDGFWTGWRSAPIQLPFGPVVGIDAVDYDAPDGIAVTLDATSYALADPGYQTGVGLMRTAFASGAPAVSPHGAAVRITYTAGYPDVPATETTPEITTVPSPARIAVLMAVADLYANREAQQLDQSRGVAVQNAAVEALLLPLRVYR